MSTSDRPAWFTRWDALAFLGLAALYAAYRIQGPSLPDPLPTHFDARGVANGWTSKAALPYVLFGLPIGLWTLITLTSRVSALGQTDPAKARALAAAPMRGFLGLGLAALMGGLLYVPARGTQALFVGLGVFVACLVAGIGVMIRDFARMPRNPQDDAFYKWKLFYYNPDDPRLLVEKRLGVGYTFNFARPASWLILGLVLLPLGLLLAR